MPCQQGNFGIGRVFNQALEITKKVMVEEEAGRRFVIFSCDHQMVIRRRHGDGWRGIKGHWGQVGDM